MAEQTRQRLIDGTFEAIRRHGIAGISARTIAAVAGVNQALVFYHFGTVYELLTAACVDRTELRVATYRERLATVTSLRELLAVGRDLHAEERTLGNVQVLAQMLAGAQTDPQLAGATAAALRLWVDPIEQALARILAGSPLADLLDTAGLARAASAAFIGLELFEGVDPAGATAAMDTVERLAVLAEVVDDLGPVARRTLRARLRRLAT